MEPDIKTFHSPAVINAYRAVLAACNPKKSAEFKKLVLDEYNQEVGMRKHDWILTSDIIRAAKALRIRIKI